MKYIFSILLMGLAWYSLLVFWHVDIGQISLWNYFAGIVVFAFLQIASDIAKE